MDSKITQEILDDLITSLEALEVKSTAVLEFLKHEGIASDEKLAPYVEEATNASNVRWLGVRVRIERLLSSAEKDSAKRQTANEEKKPANTQTKPDDASQSQPEAVDKPKSSDPENPNENVDKNKKSETRREDTESKTNVAASNSTRNDQNGDRLEASEDKSRSAVTGRDQKAA
jgi:hypothetical protein